MNSQLFRGLAAALAVAALGAGAAACGSSGSTGKSGTSGASQASSAPGSSSSPTSSTPGNTSASGTTTGASGSSTGGTNGTKSPAATGGQAGASEAVGRCHTGDLAIGFVGSGSGVPDMHGNQTTAALWLKNTSGHTCTLYGFPGVDIINKSDPNNPWPLRRVGATPTKVTLRPGAQTGFVITLLPADGSYSQSERVVPETLLVTPPGETQHFTLKWPYGGAIVNQSMATRPGTYVGPING